MGSGYSEGDHVVANKTHGGFLESDVPEGTHGTVRSSTIFGNYEVQWDNGQRTEISGETIRRAEGGGLFS